MSAASPKASDMVLALPVKGESFLLRRAGRTVLVDGGLPSDRIARVLKQQNRDVQRLDVVLCTHGDRDHAGGLPNLLDDWAGQVGQLWLPGRWVDVVPRLAHDPAAFLDELVRELDAELKAPSDEVLDAIRDADDEVSERDRRDAASPQQSREAGSADGRFDDADEALDAQEPLREPDWFSRLRRAAGELASDHESSRAFNAARRKVRRRHNRLASKLDTRIALYWLDLIETAKAIRGITVAAVRHGIRTRWFDFEEFARTRRAVGGAPGFLVPINAVEQAPPPSALLLYKALTLINQQSLVFLAPPALFRLGVLFSGDSPLGDGKDFTRSFLPARPLPNWPIVATAPHHGSETNSIAYAHLNEWADVVVLLRAGGSAKQPGNTFLEQNGCLRLCARCARAGHVPMLSGVVATRPHWPLMHTLGRRCDCHTSRFGVSTLAGHS
jgi:hypothetical protein